MKEMCKNFICDGCGTMPAAAMSDAAMHDCNACMIERVGLAQALIPDQPWQMPMSEEQSLVCGTVFADLAMPYCSGWNLYRFGKEASV